MKLRDIGHQKVFSILEKSRRGKILDAGAGKGDLSEALHKIGFDVTACDIEPGKRGSIRIQKVDMNKKLPFKNSTFNYIVAVEVIEHLENPYHIVREFRRVMKKGGWLFLTTPNIANIFSRVKFLLHGTFFAFSKRERQLGHTDPIPFWQIREILEANGFKVKEISSNQHLQLSGLNTPSAKAKRVAAKVAYNVLLPVVQPKDIHLLKGDSIFVIARRV